MSAPASPSAAVNPNRAAGPGAAASALHELVAKTVAERVAKGAYKVPLLPQVASQVVSLTATANVDASKLSALIHRDPSLAGQVLRIANSASYAPRMPIVSLQQAVARLGLTVISEIAFAASLQSGIFKVPGFEADLKAIWRHSLASGMWAKEIARLQRSNVESAFLCGLLHDVGKPALLQLVIDVARELKGTPESGWLRGFVWGEHQMLGRKVAEAWELPTTVVAAIGHYADYSNVPPALAPTAKTTCLADRLATWATDPQAFDEKTLRDHAVFVDLNLYPEEVNGLLGKRAAVLGLVESLMVV
ncbi:MAG TPA: HDOD domain-containing protein [Polyangia bacterium]